MLGLGSNNTTPINYSTSPATLQSNIQAALDGLSGVGTGNSVVSAVSATDVTVTFQGVLAAQPVPTLSNDPTLLQGTSPTLAVATTTAGFTDPGLTVAAPGVLANDTTTTTDALTSTLITPPAHGTLTFNPDGSFVYTPALNYLGPDSFVYRATDPGITSGGSNTPSATATVTLNVTPRLSIPTNLAVSPNTQNAVQTITFGGTVTGGSFLLVLDGTTTGSIAYSTSAAALQSNIQAALDNLPNVTVGNSVVSAVSATNVTVTFQGALTDTVVDTMTDIPSLQGTNPTMAVATTTLAGPFVVVPVIMDNPNPSGSSSDGLAAATLAIDYNSAVFSVFDIEPGTLTSSLSWSSPVTNVNFGTDAVQTITFGGTVTGGTFVLSFEGSATSPISYSTDTDVLGSNIQSALDSLSTIGPSNTFVDVVSDTNVTVTFQGPPLAATPVPLLQDTPSLQGTNPTMAIATTTPGVLPTGQLAAAMASSSPVTTTSSGSLLLVTFMVNPNAPGGPSIVTLAATNAPSGFGVTTRIDAASGQLPIYPALANPPTFCQQRRWHRHGRGAILPGHCPAHCFACDAF